MWFRFTAGNDERFELTTLRPFGGGSFDTKLFVFSGSCRSLNCVASDDDGGVDFLSSLTYTAVGPTREYFVYLNGFGPSDVGSYNLYFAKGLLPPNDSCQDAVTLSVGGSTAMSTYFGSTGVGTNALRTVLIFVDFRKLFAEIHGYGSKSLQTKENQSALKQALLLVHRPTSSLRLICLFLAENVVV